MNNSTNYNYHPNNGDKRHLIVCDLDGTLLRNNETISEYTASIVHKLCAQGHVFCLATGRPLRSSFRYYQQLKLNTIVGNLNCAILSNPSDPCFERINLTFSKKILEVLLTDQEVIQNVAAVFVENVDGSYLFADQPLKEAELAVLLKSLHVAPTDPNIHFLAFADHNQICKDPNTILFYIREQSKIEKVAFKVKKLTSTLVTRTWSLYNDMTGMILELNSIFSNKLTFVRFLSSYYGIPLPYAYTFGDGENDIEMLKLPNGYAMRNGNYQIKLASPNITRLDNDQDGVAKELSRIFNLE